ncbi:C39 family peptidase [Vagococcus hydrophili]|uniref:Peptidase C39-like domain-containing protein n=1 Tax=Vagococcus hydrophili TaxID=2714947 RepID=A0A6G8AQX2_9ENTE|nr:C39 family peptidase [Vagococcus hydrophili]QIL47396.1 hypothetical protein G7082_02035 [Vagococcus hydrophili]
MKNKILLGCFSCMILVSTDTYLAEEVVKETTTTSSSSVVMSTESTELTQETTESITSHSVEKVSPQKNEDIKEEDTAPISENQKEEIHQFISVNKEHPMIYLDMEEATSNESSFVKGQTFLAKEKITKSDGNIFYLLFNHLDEKVGFVSSNDIELAGSQGGVYQSFWKYGTDVNVNGSAYSDFEGTVKNSLVQYKDLTLRVRGKYHSFDGTIYYSMDDNKGNWLGYVSEKDLTITEGAQGSYQEFGQNVIINKDNYTIWQNFNWQKKYDSKQFLNRTFVAKGMYRHFNGDTYYSLYDLNDKWYGYINSTGTKLTTENQGEYVSYNKYVTVKNSGGSAWNSFSWNARQPLSQLANKTYKAKGIYYHANGEDYLSLYDKDNKWQGYVNKNFVTVADGAQGGYQNYDKYVSITKNNYTMWQNFDWKKRGDSKNIYEKTFLAKGKYQHYNGETYLSIFDSSGKWYGYINSNGTKFTERSGYAIPMNKVVTVTNGNYDLWRNLNFSSKKGTTKGLVNKPYKVKYKYEHYNGSTYYSMYEGDNWLGYLNNTGVKEAAGKNSTYVMLNAPTHNQNDIHADMGCEAASLLQALQVKGFAKNYTLAPFIEEMPRSKNNNPNEGFSGSPYVVRDGVYHSIFPKPLTKWANDYAHGTAADISGTEFKRLSNELEKGNPIVLYITLEYAKPRYHNYHWGRGVENAHVVTLDGYNSQTNMYHLVDPNDRGVNWVSASTLQASYQYNEKKSVVIR